MKNIGIVFCLVLAMACNSSEKSTNEPLSNNASEVLPSTVAAPTVKDPALPKVDTPTKVKTEEKKAEKKEKSTEEIAQTDYSAMAKEMCQCFADVEKELKPADIALMESFSKKVNKDMATDTAALRRIMKENQKEVFALGMVMFRMQKHLKPDSPAKICLDEKGKQYKMKNKKLSEQERNTIASALETQGCKLLATIFRLGEGFM